LRATQATLQTARLNLEFTRVVSPIDGYLTNFDTSLGTSVTAGEQLLALVDRIPFGLLKRASLHSLWRLYPNQINASLWNDFLWESRVR
jgi:multidrug efflux pump subunit AcrA (membrane-fusion protein)